MNPKFHPLQVIDIHHETEDAVSIGFAVPNALKEEFSFYAGQYITIKATIAGEEVRRSYSICAAPNEQTLRVAVKRVENGKFSTWATNDLKIGDTLEVMTPAGNFKLTPAATNQKSYALFAAGSGITPIISIIKTILAEEPMSEVTLFYGNKGFSSIIFREELEALKNRFMQQFRLIHILSRESLGNVIQKGRIDDEKVRKLCSGFLNPAAIDEVYVCGPEAMIHAVKNELNAFGVPEKQIHFELFGTGYVKQEKKEVAVSEIVASKVTIILDDDRYELNLDSNGKNILEAGFEAGADLPYACKGGVCCTCKAKIIEGTASMDINYALEKEEVEAGYILTCQAHPTSSNLVISFDE
jgi:ring-1,2-phenylacetyl-CoA epoxidase subunit PaaE|uniref:1,2-phenylacetyl-CoA epoxidase subunit PaaE n=1 Tax=Fluviicola sp. TaxID=1917219 RepID=UPI004049A1E5